MPPQPVLDEAFRNAGKKKGIEIWRIEKFMVVPVPRARYGNFYSGDSYIVLSTKEFDSWDIHFWIGKESSQDEYGAAAIKTVELDNLLGGLPVEYREVQGYESTLFQSYFKDGIKYLEGGIASGFTHVESPEYEPILYQCKGKRLIRCWQVPPKFESLNDGDVFVFDGGLEIYVWMPPMSGRLERIKGINIGRNIRDHERAGRGNVHVLDFDWDSNELFYDKLGGRKGKVKDGKEAGGDLMAVRRNRESIKLFKCSDASGKLEIAKIADMPLNFDMLKSEDAFMLDAGNGGVFCWIGKECTMHEREKAMEWAEEYLKRENRPKHTPLIRVLDTGEPAIFTQWFSGVPMKLPKFEVKLFQCSDETGELKVEQVPDYTYKDLDGDDVMILDTGMKVFVWIGANANEKEKKHAKTVAKKYIDTDSVPRPKNAEIVVQNQGKESDEFIGFFPLWVKERAGKVQSLDDAKKKINRQSSAKVFF